MITQILVGVGIGLTSFLLYASATQFSALALILFYLAPLPIMLATLGWGRAVGILAGVTAWIGVTAAIAPVAGLTYLASVAAPSILLAYLAGLSRPVADQAPTPVFADEPPVEADPAAGTDLSADQPAPAPAAENDKNRLAWYPIGRVVLWAVAWGIVSSTIALIWFSSGPEGLIGRVRTLLDSFMLTQPIPNAQNNTSEPLDAATLDSIVSLMSRLMFPAVTAIWTLTMLGNLWMSGKILQRSKRLHRPWPNIRAIQYPRMTGLVFVAVLGASMMPGAMGQFALIAAAGLGLALVLLGLAVVHAMTVAISTRSLILVAVYSAMVLFAWPALILVVVGLAELLLALRARRPARLPPPSGTT